MSVVTSDRDHLLSQERRSVLENFLNRWYDGSDVSGERNWRTLINVEPVIIMLSVSLGLCVISMPLFTYWARCIEIASSTHGIDPDNVTAACAQSSGSDLPFQDVVAKDIASTRIYLQIVNTVPNLITAPLIGTWSDKRGRKNPLLFTIFGFCIYSVIQLLATLTYNYISIYYFFFAGELLIGLTGGAGSLFSMTLAIVTDDCRHKLKPGSSTVPLRIGIASFLQSVGTFFGTLIMTFLAVPALYSSYRHQLSYVEATSLQTLCALIAFAYAYFVVRETHFPLDENYLFHRIDGGGSDDNIEQQSSSSVKTCGNLFGLCEVLTQKRPGWTRFCLNMSLMFAMVEFLASDVSLLFLLVKRQPFSWSDKLFTYYSLARGVLYSIGMVLCPLLLTLVHWLGKDSLMILIGIAASAVAFIFISYAQSTTVIFLTAALTVLCGGIAPGYRSFLPRMVPKEQTARLLTVCTIIGALCPVFSAAIFNSIFYITLTWWPGFAFFVSGILQLLVVGGQGAIHILMRPQWLAEKRLRAQINAHSLTVGCDNPVSDEPSTTASVVDPVLNDQSLEEHRRTVNV
ncbi:hypothetical protein KIN20_004795 [Parelaphostrongylus tenuis]|uniref:Major facilitator superfamily (MFS) profile domain-containing protein n=1 Tax=Parelaphostrongylus tenuis TaxID=148309 RepID=A0AAD5QJL5_PARTN|nr:hypothetical protein KIN20_004795 [Parelaphostrongylus tenuis]